MPLCCQPVCLVGILNLINLECNLEHPQLKHVSLSCKHTIIQHLPANLHTFNNFVCLLICPGFSKCGLYKLQIFSRHDTCKQLHSRNCSSHHQADCCCLDQGAPCCCLKTVRPSFKRGRKIMIEHKAGGRLASPQQTVVQTNFKLKDQAYTKQSHIQMLNHMTTD